MKNTNSGVSVSNRPAKARPFLLSVLLVLGLAACGDPTAMPTTVPPTATVPAATALPATATAAPTATAMPTATPAPTSTPTVQPTATVAPPTPTVAAVNTPTTGPVSPAVAPVGPPKASLDQLDEGSNGVVLYELEGDIWVMTLPEGVQRNLTGDGANTKMAFPDGYNRRPVWDKNSLSIAYASPAEASQQQGYQNGYDIYTMRPDGSNRTRLTNRSDSPYVRRLPLGWFSPNEIIISQYDNKNPQSGMPALALLEIATGNIRELPIKQSGITLVAVSPDGSQVAYVAPVLDPKTNSTKADVFVVPVAGGQPKALTDFPSAVYQSISALAWSPNGQNLAFVQAVGDGCGTYNLYTVTSDGKTLRKWHSAVGYPLTVSYAARGNWLAYSAADCAALPTLYFLNLLKSGPPLDLGNGSNPSYGKRISG